MLNLVVGFALSRRKRSVTLEGEDTSSFEGKRPRQSPLCAEAQKEWAIVLVESLDQASDD